jgi:hypothetical protein
VLFLSLQPVVVCCSSWNRQNGRESPATRRPGDSDLFRSQKLAGVKRELWRKRSPCLAWVIKIDTD